MYCRNCGQEFDAPYRWYSEEWDEDYVQCPYCHSEEICDVYEAEEEYEDEDEDGNDDKEFDLAKVRLKGHLKDLKVGSKGFFADDVLSLREQVRLYCVPATLTKMDNSFKPFQKDGAFWYTYFYLVKEPKKRRKNK